MTSTTTSSADPPDRCRRCGYGPCCCSYIKKLMAGGELSGLHDAAVAQLDLPLPHRPACPCPICYSSRMASWSSGAVAAADVVLVGGLAQSPRSSPILTGESA